MIGRILCRVGFHDWVYRESGAIFHLTREYVRRWGMDFGFSCPFCLRCGKRP